MCIKKIKFKKIELVLLVLILLVSACSNISKPTLEEQPSVTIEKEEVISISFDECSNPKELQEYFSSVNYSKLAKTGDLIIPQITPGLFKTNNVQLKKEAFFKSIYPIAYKINQEIKQERRDLLAGKNIEKLQKKYKTTNIENLKIRIDIIPITIIMAQAATESAYGTSRFAEEGNALFGQWTTAKNGMTPREKPNSKWKVARYDTPLDSARAYALNVNTNRVYSKLRNLRANDQDPINGLEDYSQKGKDYIVLLNSVIKRNNLNQYK